MPKIPVADLSAGMTLARPLFDVRGRMLLASDRPLSGAMLEMLRGSAKHVWLGGIDEPGIGVPTTSVAWTGRGLPLVDAPAAEINERRVARRSREQRLQIARVRAAIRREAEQVIRAREERWRRLPLKVVAEGGAPEIIGTIRPTEPVQADEAGAIDRFRRERAAVLEGVYRRLAFGEEVGTGGVHVIVDELIDEARRRPAALASLALAHREHTDALVEHALGVGILSVAIATALRWSEADVRAAAWSGLLADVGIALLASNVRAVARGLTEEETNALHRHPVYGAAALEHVRPGAGGVDGGPMDERVQLAVMQHHEREDGSGYPRRLRSGEIHDLAKVVAVADVFLALTEPRAHRPALGVDEALTHVVRRANAGVLGRDAARGLVTALGLRSAAGPVGARAAAA